MLPSGAKSTELELSLRFGPMIESMTPEEAVEKAYKGLLQKILDLSVKPDSGKLRKLRLVFSDACS